MKISTERSRAKRNMAYVGNTKNRPEQILAEALLKLHLPLWCRVETEYEVSLFDADNPDTPYERSIDIAVWNQGKKFAIELNGPPHDEVPQIRKDSRRQVILEWKGNDWKYIVFDYIKMPTLFERAKRKLTYDEAVKAYGEILVAIGDALPLGEPRKEMIETVLRKTQLNEPDQDS